MHVDEQVEGEPAIFPLVRDVQSAPSPDGKALLVEVGTELGRTLLAISAESGRYRS